MARTIQRGIDKLFVEGTDDRAVVNALVQARVGVDIAEIKLVETKDAAGVDWALREFAKYTKEARLGTRIGVIVDRDGIDRRPDHWPRLRELLRPLGMAQDAPTSGGMILDGRIGAWMWPDNTSLGDLEDFVTGIVPSSPPLLYAAEACRLARHVHGAEYDAAHERKATLKVRGVWRDATTAAGYGHLVRSLPLTETPAATAFIAWFTTLFLS